MREGQALHDSLYPDRIVVGAEDRRALEVLRELYEPILEQSFTPPPFLPRPEGMRAVPFLTTDLASAELIKYGANAFLALKISFINELARLAERVGADIREVARGIGLDHRIGPRFLQAGLGWGKLLPQGHGGPPRHGAGVRPQASHRRGGPAGELWPAGAFGGEASLRAQDPEGPDRGPLGSHLQAPHRRPPGKPRPGPGGASLGAWGLRPGPRPRGRPPGQAGGEPPPGVRRDPRGGLAGGGRRGPGHRLAGVPHLALGRLRGLLRTPLVVDGRNLLDGRALAAWGYRYVGVGVPALGTLERVGV